MPEASNSTNNNNNNKSNDALMELLAPDGYYTYLQIPKTTPTAANEPIDADLVKKRYRKLSLQHHPDKKGGHPDTFRLLNRAQTVLLEPKLRAQYDVLGMDLDDEDAPFLHDDGNVQHKENSLIQEMAGNVLTAVIQCGVRTIMLGVTSCLLVRYRWTLIPGLLFLGYVMVQIAQKSATVPGGSLFDTLPPSLIGVGCVLMSTSAITDVDTGAVLWMWNAQYWMGESLVIFMFLYNSLPEGPKARWMVGSIGVGSLLAALWFRGKVWNYFGTIVVIALLAVAIAVAFPMMELLLEAILNEKLKKIGDHFRHQHKVTKEYYESKLK